VADALRGVPLVPPGERRTGLITERLRPVFSLPGFAPAAEAADLDGDPARLLSSITAVMAEAYLANTPTALIALLHGVTGPSATRLLLPHVSPRTGGLLLRNGWQAAAALYSAHAVRPPEAGGPAEPEEPRDAAARADEALNNGDEHAIKMTEACLREDAVAPRAVYLRAARDACGRLG
jgi:hypothetical protein